MFLELLEGGVIESVSVDSDQSDKIIRLLDTVVIKLEGGTDEDLKVLDEDTSSAPNAATGLLGSHSIFFFFFITSVLFNIYK